ncbi:MAG: hypothetical protein JXR96_12925 [Deltaproteobacteria bacterium]|nr:hypothetical protein [Deltaproteobacteria bacterium]
MSRVALRADVLGDGHLSLAWDAHPNPSRHTLLIQRTGSVPAYTSIGLDGSLRRYEILSLSRHQRYLVCMLASRGKKTACSDWLSVTPRAGLAALPSEELRGFESRIARVDRLHVMPQERRLTAFWHCSPGFADKVAVELMRGRRLLGRLMLEPEVKSVALDASRGIAIEPGKRHTIKLFTLFAGTAVQGPPPVVCTPAPQGHEREANREHPQAHLIYPTLSLAPELRIFEDESYGDDEPELEIRCAHCRAEVHWQDYRLLCSRCGAEFIPNGRGEYLECSRLRFGTCQCCLPRKILVQKAGSSSLVCAHSGKEHIRMPGRGGYSLIEDLPYGLCQCCRPRQPLVRSGETIRCSRSGELHENQDGQYVWAPSQPVFDASAIDELLDAGLAEICSTGVSRRRN